MVKKKPKTASKRMADADEAAFRRVLARVEVMEKYRAVQNTPVPENTEAEAKPESRARQKPSRRKSATARLFVIRAREAPMAAILRRGPSKQVRLISWNTDTDSFEGGQWLKGRIYERRCDLSPDGRYLIYFAANHKGQHFSWTSISRPPYLTALAFWPKGDCWEGGGLFEDARNIWLNDQFSDAEEDAKVLPDSLKLWVKGFGGGDNPIHGVRLLRDGWILAQPGKSMHVPWDERDATGYHFPYDPPQVWERPSASGDRLRMVIHGVGEESGDWYVVTHEIATPGGETVSLGRTDWADWDRNGDLLYARNGKLYRLSPGKNGNLDPKNSRELADFNDDRFQAIPPPEEATRW